MVVGGRSSIVADEGRWAEAGVAIVHQALPAGGRAAQGPGSLGGLLRTPPTAARPAPRSPRRSWCRVPGGRL